MIIITFFSPRTPIENSLFYKRNLAKLATIQPKTSKTKKKLEIQNNMQNPT